MTARITDMFIFLAKYSNLMYSLSVFLPCNLLTMPCRESTKDNEKYLLKPNVYMIKKIKWKLVYFVSFRKPPLLRTIIITRLMFNYRICKQNTTTVHILSLQHFCCGCSGVILSTCTSNGVCAIKIKHQLTILWEGHQRDFM